MANLITALRILFSIAILFCPVFSLPFYVLYFAAGITDMIDGTVARKTNSESEFGSRFDTFADFVFVTVCLIKVLPEIRIKFPIYIWILLIALLKLINFVSGWVLRKKSIVVHSVMNKVTGTLLFALPLIMVFIDLNFIVIAACCAASLASFDEGYYIRKGNCLFLRKKQKDNNNHCGDNTE